MSRSVIFAGGGTAGPVTPLLAVADAMKRRNPELRIAWAGTETGPERDLVEPYGYPYFAIPVAKLPRYVSLRLLTAPFDFYRARRTARDMMVSIHPNVVVSAGGFTAVPVVRAANAYRIPCVSHQLDCIPGLSNLLVARKSRYVTTSFAYSDNPFGRGVASYPIPTPTRFGLEDLPMRADACQYFNLDPSKKVLFVTGGGTGALAINRAMWKIAPGLPDDVQVIHLTGKGKKERTSVDREGYIIEEFFTDEMMTAYAAADLVVSRRHRRDRGIRRLLKSGDPCPAPEFTAGGKRGGAQQFRADD